MRQRSDGARTSSTAWISCDDSAAKGSSKELQRRPSCTVRRTHSGELVAFHTDSSVASCAVVNLRRAESSHWSVMYLTSASFAGFQVSLGQPVRCLSASDERAPRQVETISRQPGGRIVGSHCR